MFFSVGNNAFVKRNYVYLAFGVTLLDQNRIASSELTFDVKIKILIVSRFSIVSLQLRNVSYVSEPLATTGLMLG